MKSDDVRSSLDLLDRVIGEFDDGLLSSTESESPVGHQQHFGRSTRYFEQDDDDESHIEANIRRQPPPKGKQGNPGGQLRTQNRRTLSDQVDDIFSELNQELYADRSPVPARRPPTAVAPKTDTTSQWVAKHRQRSPVRRMDDPLPSPPLALEGKSGAKVRDEVVVYTTEKQEFFSLKKSVKAQVHSLEAKTKLTQNGQGGRGRHPIQRSKSENPPLIRGDNNNQPPPMPEKTKIHLKNTQSIERKTVGQVQNRFDKTNKKPAQNSAAGKISKLDNFDVNDSRKTPTSESRQQQFRRARSVGPVVEAAQRELSNLDLTKVLPGATNPANIIKERKSRSRARTENNSNGLFNARSKTSLGTNEVSRRKADSFNSERKQINPSLGVVGGVDSSSRHSPNKMPARQKSMIDLREPFWPEQPPHHLVHPVQFGRIPGASSGPAQNPRNMPPPALVRSATEHDIRLRSKRPMPTFHDLPPHIRQHMIRQHGLGGLGPDPSSLGRKGYNDPESYAMRQLNLEAQRELLVRRGFSPTHPYISGEIPIHPELQGQLPFNVPSRTIPLRPEDYRRFKPELWLQDHNPNPVPFSDLAVLHNELELRRRREIYRQNSQRRPGSVADIDANNFTSLPWDEIVPRRQMEQFQQQLQQHIVEQQHQIIIQQQKNKSAESRRKNRPFGLFQNSGWFNPTNQVLREDEASESVNSSRMKKQGHWVLKERSPDQMQSMPPIIPVGTLKDSGIGEEQEIFTRSGAARSSFGMALKDKFQRNPNMYFPPDGQAQTIRTSSSTSSGGNNTTKRHSMASKSTSIDDLSDTDTLIHNMSEGSFEKDRTSLGSGEQNSLGSASGHGSRSSGNSSLSPQNSMEGSPRMIPKQASKFKSSSTALQAGPKSISSSDVLGVSFNKKTIRNYTPKESSTMLREFEDRRNNSFDWREKEKRASSQPPVSASTPSAATTRPTSRPSAANDELKVIHQDEKKRFVANTRKDGKVDSHPGKGHSGVQAEDKSSMERMIEDFHRSLPPPPVDGRQQQPQGRNNEPADQQVVAASTTASSSKRTSKHGTLTSQISNWSAASSVASFDYQPARQRNEPILPALKEVEYGPNETPVRSRNQTPKGERVPPEGASADSPRSFVQLIEVGEKKVEKAKPKALSSSDLVEEAPAGDNDEFSNLRKLISEGRISGLSEKPPSFIPPTPPTSKRTGPGRKDSSAGSGLEKKPSRSSADRPRKTREAPKPPATSQESPILSKPSQQLVNPDVKLLNSRHRESLEDLTQMETRRRRSGNVEIKRSSSNHGNRPNGFDLRNVNVEATTAQLIADSTEKKFNFNPFKNMWKKKHYSFDFN